MKGMILAAGFGTRFRPVTYEMPKPMVPLCNEPLLGYAVRSLLDADVREIVINLHHLPEAIEEWARKKFSSEATLHFSFEPEILGTGGGVRNVRHLLGDDEFVLVNGDTVQHPPIARLIEARRRTDALAALLLREPPAHDRFTRVWFDGSRVNGFGQGTGTPLMFSGCHAFSPRIFDFLPDRDFSGITEDVYIPVTREGGETLAGVVDNGYWFDIGTPSRYLSASKGILEMMLRGEVASPNGSTIRGTSLVAESATLQGTTERSVIGPHVDSAAQRILDSSIWEAARIGSGAVVERSVVGPGVTLPEGSVVMNALVCMRRAGIEYIEPVRVMGDFAVTPVDPAAPFIFRS